MNILQCLGVAWNRMQNYNNLYVCIYKASVIGWAKRVTARGDRPVGGRAHGPECHGILVPQLVTHI